MKRHLALLSVCCAMACAGEADPPSAGLAHYPVAAPVVPPPAVKPELAPAPPVLRVRVDDVEVASYSAAEISPQEGLEADGAGKGRAQNRRLVGTALKDLLARHAGSLAKVQAVELVANGSPQRLPQPEDPTWVVSVNRRGMFRLARPEGDGARGPGGQGDDGEAKHVADTDPREERRGKLKKQKAWATGVSELHIITRGATAQR